VGWGHAAGRCVGLGYLRGEAALVSHQGTPIELDLFGEPVAARAWDRWNPSSA
jgi:4-methylaminobutanoate oxidase (formaldehyde-forming)